MNQTLTSLVSDVYTLTNRSDLVGETLIAVRNATLKAHSADFYYKDIFETGVQFLAARQQQNLEYKELIPRWRALKYLRPCIQNEITETSEPQEFLSVLTPEALMDSYGKSKENVCYVAGAEIHIRTSAAYKYFLLGCYVHPNVTVEHYCSWIADEHPAAIIYEAAAIVFKTIGYDEQEAAYRRMVADEYRLIQQSNIQAIGY